MRFRLSDHSISCSAKLIGNKLLPIQALRGLAASMIVIQHAFHEAGLERPFYPFTFGVDIFFVISGFIMVYTSREKFGKPGVWKVFMARRLMRIVPVYWFYTTVLIAVALIMPRALQTITFEPWHVLLSYLFIPHVNPSGSLHPFLDLGWTLNYEMFFYAVFAGLLFLPMRTMLAALTVLFAGFAAAGLFIPADYPAPYFWTRPVILEFVGGAWVAYAYVRGFRLPRYSVLGLPLVFVLLAAVPLTEDFIRMTAEIILALAAVAFAILPQNIDESPVPRWAAGLGDASYTIYLSHPFVLGVGAMILGVLPPWPLFFVIAAGAVFGGYLLYLVIEKPLLSLTKRVFLFHPRASGERVGL